MQGFAHGVPCNLHFWMSCYTQSFWTNEQSVSQQSHIVSKHLDCWQVLLHLHFLLPSHCTVRVLGHGLSLCTIHVITDFSYFKRYLKNQYLFSQVIKRYFHFIYSSGISELQESVTHLLLLKMSNWFVLTRPLTWAVFILLALIRSMLSLHWGGSRLAHPRWLEPGSVSESFVLVGPIISNTGSSTVHVLVSWSWLLPHLSVILAYVTTGNGHFWLVSLCNCWLYNRQINASHVSNIIKHDPKLAVLKKY